MQKSHLSVKEEFVVFYCWCDCHWSLKLSWLTFFSTIFCVCGNPLQCFEEAGGEWKELKICVDGDEGKKLQLQAERITKEIAKPKLKNVPTVVFNDVR